ncbi:MAG: transglycosylase domain-containing protein, partial [Oscillospiraceae bacterium]
ENPEAEEASGEDESEYSGAGDTLIFDPEDADSTVAGEDSAERAADDGSGGGDGGSGGGDGTDGESGDGKKKKKRGKKPKKKRSLFARIVIGILKVLCLLLCLCIIAGCVMGVMVAVYVVNATADDDTLLDLNQLKLSYSTRLMAYDDDTGTWHEYQRIYGTENRIWVDYSDMPQCLIDATVASEDVRFWKHNGVDWKRTIAAFLNLLPGVNLFSTKQGGSTIYQQLIKNITGDDETSGLAGILRKITEIYRALVMNKRFSKEQVLEAYLNTIRLSGTLAGVESAANAYFGKTTSELTAAESAAIVCVTKYPTAYNPFLHPDENQRQREQILYTMHEQGWLTDNEYAEALEESATMVFGSTEYTQDANTEVWSWFTDTAVAEVIYDLQRYNGLTEDEAIDEFYNGGLTVYLTIDEDIQAIMDDTVLNDDATDDYWPDYLTSVSDVTGEEQHLEGGIILMNYQGELLGLEGSMYEKTTSLAFNRATGPIGDFLDGGLRQTGSAIKPIAVYGPAIQMDKITYSTLFPDAPITIEENGTTTQWPRNYSNTYGSPVTVNVALRQSLNTIAARIMHYLVTPDYSFDYLTNFLGFTHLQETTTTSDGTVITDRTDSLALGGLTNGESVYEMTAAFQIFGNGGVFTEGHCYRYVEDSKGTVIIDKASKVKVTQALDEDSAYIMNRLLREVFTSGTAYNVRYGDMDLVGKTGTSSDNSDNWIVGMNPYYVCGVWAGYDEPEYVTNIWPRPAQLIWRKIMSQVSEGLEYKEFPTSDNVVARTFCLESGDLASSSCTNVATGYYKQTNIPDVCDGTADALTG